MGRRNPYTDTGIKRVPCFRCGKPSSQQWQICALNNEYKGVCTKCDIELNKLVLKFFSVSCANRKAKQYAYQVCLPAKPNKKILKILKILKRSK